MKKRYLYIVLIILIFAGCTNNNQAENNPQVKGQSVVSGEENVSTLSEIQETTPPEEVFPPENINLEVPFISQAPFANWDDLHNEACEEASILSVVGYLGNISYDKDQADQEIINMVNWQIKNFGGHYDLPAEKIKELIDGFYAYKYETIISYDVSIEDIKKELSKNNPVIIPASGRTLGNPNFRQPGPVYHMLVIRGYNDNKKSFITNDVGTRKGEEYIYKYDTIMNSIHDMPSWEQTKSTLDANPNLIFSGRKAIIIIKNK